MNTASPPAQPAVTAAAPAASNAATPETDVKPGPTRSMTSVASLMALGHKDRTLPEDFKIGPLGDGRGVKQEENNAIAAARTFLKSIVAGSVDTRLLTPDSQDAITDTLAYNLKQGFTPLSFRLGAPKSQDNGQITATVRLFSASGASEGEIYLSKAGTEWLVADLQVSFAQLSVKREPAKEKYLPSSYRWLLEDN